MELRHLRYFVAVAEEKNVTRAAARLHVSQPPLSRQIRDLEKELGVRLFERSAHGLHITEAGAAFFTEAQGILRRADEAVDRIKELALGKRGKVRVAHASPAVEVLRRVLRSFSQTHPEVGVELLELTGKGIERGLRERALDVVLTVAGTTPDLDGSSVEDLGTCAVRVALSKQHRFARLREVRLRDLAGEPIVACNRHEHPDAHAGLLALLAPYTRSPNFVEEHDTFASQVAAVEAGRGIAFVSQSMSLIAGKRLVLRPIRPSPPPLPITMIYRSDGASGATAAFVAATRASLGAR